MIVEGLSGIFAQIGKNPDANDGSWWGGKSTIEKGIEVVRGFGEPLLNLAKGVEAMANLKFPTGFDKDGKPTGYETIKNVSGLKDKIGANTRMLIQALVDTFIQVGKTDLGSNGWFSTNDFENGVEIVNQVGKPYKNLATAVAEIQKAVGSMDTQAFKGKVIDIVSVFTDEQVGGSDIELMNNRRWLIDSIGKSFEKLGTAVPPNYTSSFKF